MDPSTRSTAELLSAGGDSRHAVDGTGHNTYGCAYTPEPECLSFGSCTASSVSEAGFEAARRVHGWLNAIPKTHLRESIDDLFDAARRSIFELLARDAGIDVDIALTPSGTDAELIALAVVAGLDDLPIENILLGPAEVGSGTPLAAAGCHFDPLTPSGREVEPGEPVDPVLVARTVVHRVALRASDGRERPVEDIDREVTELVEAGVARGARVLLHVIAHSKTGVHAPSLPSVAALVERYREEIFVVIDAAQGRVSRRGLCESLRKGYMMIVTGSKFFGGPPFAGAVLVPRSLSTHHRGLRALPSGFDAYLTESLLPREWATGRSLLPSASNLGLLLRWSASIAEMRDYYLVPARLRLDVLRAYERMVPALFGPTTTVRLEPVSPPLMENEAERLLESKTTVFPFTCNDPATGRRLDFGELQRVHQLMRTDLSSSHAATCEADRAVLSTKVLLGQPVRLDGSDQGPAALRLALSGVHIVRSCVIIGDGRTFDERLRKLESEVRTVRDKLDLVMHQREAWLAEEHLVG